MKKRQWQKCVFIYILKYISIFFCQCFFIYNVKIRYEWNLKWIFHCSIYPTRQYGEKVWSYFGAKLTCNCITREGIALRPILKHTNLHSWQHFTTQFKISFACFSLWITTCDEWNAWVFLVSKKCDSFLFVPMDVVVCPWNTAQMLWMC